MVLTTQPKVLCPACLGVFLYCEGVESLGRKEEFSGLLHDTLGE